MANERDLDPNEEAGRSTDEELIGSADDEFEDADSDDADDEADEDEDLDEE